MVRPAVDSEDNARAATGDPNVLLGVTPAGQADLGRTVSVAGAATPVFSKQYRIARATDSSVCAKDDVQPVNTSRQKDARDCKAPAK